MNLWLRLAWLLISSPFRPRLPPLGVSRVRLRVWLNDLDSYGHMNNGRYWTIFDLGRVDLIVRTGIATRVRRAGWTPLLGGGAVRFRRELLPLRPFVLESRLLGWAGTRLIIEQRVLTGPKHDEVATRALVIVGFYHRRERRFMPMKTLFEILGLEAFESPPLEPAAQALIQMDSLLKEDGEPVAAG